MFIEFIQFDFSDKWSFVIVVEMIECHLLLRSNCLKIGSEFSFMDEGEPIMLLSRLLSFAFSYIRLVVSFWDRRTAASSQATRYQALINGLQ